MPLQETSGNLTTDAYGGGAAAAGPAYIEDVFSTWLYTGTGASQTITNGIDLSTKGGLTWIKSRSAATDHKLTDTSRGVTKELISDTTGAQTTDTTGLTAFGTTGFTIGADTNYNTSADTYVSWTFRKQPKFFDIVTYTGTGANRTISHALGSVPGSIWVKRTDTTCDWQVYHQSLANTEYLVLNSTAAKATGATRWNSTTPTSSVFSLGTDATVNASGGTYVAYIFAHNAGGFGLTGTDNVISCGSFTNGSFPNLTPVTLGWEPQFVMLKAVNGNGGWYIRDNMRGWVNSQSSTYLYANSSAAEANSTSYPGGFPSADGFSCSSAFENGGNTFIYIAIRRGPMKVPTDATKVYNVVSQTPSGTTTLTNSFAADMVLSSQRSNAGGWGFNVADKLRGSSIASGSPYLTTPTTAAEGNLGAGYGFTLTNTNVQENFWNSALGVSTPVVYDIFRRAPSFFDEVCYTGTNSGTLTNTHNLGVTPELMIGKNRGAMTNNTNWYVYHKDIANSGRLNLTNGFDVSGRITNPTTTTFDALGINDTSSSLNYSTTYVAYLFASCPGVSKVGSYTGNGTTQTINCGFGAGGARFVLLKRTDAAGDWYVYDTARGMTTLTDPYLLLNSTAAETATLGSVTTVSTGFALNSAILAAINVNAGTYIFLAVA